MPAGNSGGAPHAAGALVIVGRVRKPQGLHGEVLVQAITDAPDAIFASGARVHLGTTDAERSDNDTILTVVRARPFKDGYIVQFADASRRDDVELWRGRYLLAPQAELPGLGEGEVYQHDLIGMRVSDEQAGELGSVVAVYELPQGLTLEVGRDGRTVLVPYRPEIVREVDLDERLVRIAAPAGLLD